MESKSRLQPLIHEFLAAVEQIPVDVVSALLAASADEDEKNLINAAAPTLISQFKEVTLFANELAARATKQNLATAERFLKASSGLSLAKNLKLALPSIGSIIGRIGIAGLITEIKKIIRKLLEAFGIALPGWVDALFVLIDEIVHLLFGGGSTKLKTALSQAEQNYLAEMTLLARLEAVRAVTTDASDDEE